jgi:Fur family ferric uptake transcriptional regulator
LRPRKKLSVEVARERLKDAGMRATPARIAILKLLHESSVPMTHAEVTATLIDQGIDNSTIFRVLNDLVEAKLLVRMELGDHLWRYELSSRESAKGKSQHPHFLCVDCGSIMCLENIDFRRLLKGTTGISRLGSITEVLLKGRCTVCRGA